MTRAARLLNPAGPAVLAAAFLWLLTLSPSGAAECGIASYYAHAHHGRTQANGKPFNMHAMTAAHGSLPFGTRVRVKSQVTGRTVTVTITDRGPYVRGRIIDLSLASAQALGIVRKGVERVCIERL